MNVRKNERIHCKVADCYWSLLYSLRLKILVILLSIKKFYIESLGFGKARFCFVITIKLIFLVHICSSIHSFNRYSFIIIPLIVLFKENYIITYKLMKSYKLLSHLHIFLTSPSHTQFETLFWFFFTLLQCWPVSLAIVDGFWIFAQISQLMFSLTEWMRGSKQNLKVDAFMADRDSYMFLKTWA